MKWRCTLSLETSLPVFVACKSVGVLGCLQRCVGVKHDLVGMRAHLCVFLFVRRQYCSWICQKLCSYWRTTSCLLMSHREQQKRTKTHRYATILLTCVWLNCRYTFFFFSLSPLTTNCFVTLLQFWFQCSRSLTSCVRTFCMEMEIFKGNSKVGKLFLVEFDIRTQSHPRALSFHFFLLKSKPCVWSAIGVSCYAEECIRVKLEVYLGLLNKEYIWYYSLQGIVCWCMLLW